MTGGYVTHNDSTNGKPCLRIQPEKLLQLFQTKAMLWPTLSDAEINDRSKADWILKTVALLQILWFTTQLIGRWAQGLAVTTLELFTFGIVICAIVTYIASWEKPFDVQVPVILKTEEIIREQDLIDRVRLTENFSAEAFSWVKVVAVAVCLVFGGIHVAGWNFHFPSMAEQLLWRISSIACVVLPFTFYLATIFDESLGEITERTVSYGIISLYFLSRVYMFVEMFVSLRAAPASVYQTPQWSQYFPSFG
jgi:hypothetical protein